MARYSLSRRTTNVTDANANMEIIAPAGDALKILEITIQLAAATASVFGIGRPAAKGVGPTNPVDFLPEYFGDPTSGALRVSLAGAVGAMRVIQFPRGLIIPAGGSLIVWNIGATGVADIDVVLDMLRIYHQPLPA
jgi:hypothetical protein